MDEITEEFFAGLKEDDIRLEGRFDDFSIEASEAAIRQALRPGCLLKCDVPDLPALERLGTFKLLGEDWEGEVIEQAGDKATIRLLRKLLGQN